MKEILKNEIERVKLEKKHMLIKGVAVFVFVSFISMYMLGFVPNFSGLTEGVAGFAVYDTHEQEMDVSGTQGSVSFLQMPDFSMSVGDKFKYKIEGISGLGVFYDDTTIFNVSSEGLIEFVADEKDVGKHNVWIIYKNEQEYHYQNVVFEIEE